jgi:hypothetical protein
MTITATFSNGFTDTYKGDRSVKAAWAIIDRATGKVINSGHSLDRIKAQKTAEGNVALCVSLDHDAYPSFHLPRSAQYLFGESAKYLIGRVREAGLANDIPVGKLTVGTAFKLAKAANDRRNAAKRARVTIEVVDL